MNELIKSFVNNNPYLFLVKMKFQKLRIRFRKSVVGNNNVIINNGVLFNVKYDIVGNNNKIEIMKRALLSDINIYIRGNNHQLIIEENCIVRGGGFWFEDSSCGITIGKNTTIESAHLAVTEVKTKINIGEDCMLSNEIDLRTGDSHAIIDVEKNVKINNAQDILIGNHVWIGARSTILKGVVIGNNAIIGTGSIVTKNVSDNSIAVGIPAKIIKTNINWARERFYVKEHVYPKSE